MEEGLGEREKGERGNDDSDDLEIVISDDNNKDYLQYFELYY